MGHVYERVEEVGDDDNDEAKHTTLPEVYDWYGSDAEDEEEEGEDVRFHVHGCDQRVEEGGCVVQGRVAQRGHLWEVAPLVPRPGGATLLQEEEEAEAVETEERHCA